MVCSAAAGRRRRRRSPATRPGFRAGEAPRNKGQRYTADRPTVDEIVAVMRQAAHTRHGRRLNALIVVLWRAGLRIREALSLTETDLDRKRPDLESGRPRDARFPHEAGTGVGPAIDHCGGRSMLVPGGQDRTRRRVLHRHALVQRRALTQDSGGAAPGRSARS